MITNKEDVTYTVVRQGEVYVADLSDIGYFPAPYSHVLVIQNNKGNGVSPTTIVATISTTSPELPLSEQIEESLKYSHIRTIDKKRLVKLMGEISGETLNTVMDKLILKIAFELGGLANHG